MSELQVVVVYSTLPETADAARLARTVVEERLAACVSIVPHVRSIYRWQGGVEDDREQQVVIKTTTDRLAALQDRWLTLHPYDVPEFLVLPVTGGAEPYLRWVRESTAGPREAQS